MAEQPNEGLIQRSGSEETMIVPRRGSNAKAFKVAGLTVLACLLIAGQALTAYFVLGQSQNIRALEESQENLKKALTRKAVVPVQTQLPMNSVALLNDFTKKDESQRGLRKRRVPLVKILPAKTTNQREGSGLGEDLFWPNTPKALVQEEDTDSFLTAASVLVKCDMELTKVHPGSFKPMCDEEGNFLPQQCWSSTGFCWCVDKNGQTIEGTVVQGRAKCSGDY